MIHSGSPLTSYVESTGMVINNEQKYNIYKRATLALEQYSLEEFLEDFDLSPEDVVFELYQSGLIDPELFDRKTVIID